MTHNDITSNDSQKPLSFSKMKKTLRETNNKSGNLAFSPPRDDIWHKVVRRAVEDGRVKITLENSETYNLHRFALVGKKDYVQFRHDSEILASVPKVSDKHVVISPPWQMRQNISVCGQKLNIVVKEIETPDELEGYEALRQHHYRNGRSAARRALLIVKVNTPDLPPVVGFVEISSCFLVSVPRKKILDTPFKDRMRGIEWQRWDIETAKKYTNVTARISRCVVYPELRGIGVAGILAKAAKCFAAERWHIGGLRPSFLEITAEMLRYWPFVEKAGFVKVGETEGNGKRLEKSMSYLLQRKQDKRGFPKGGGGILTMHRAHAALLENTMKERGWSVEDIVAHIKKSPENLTIKDWVTLHGIYRRPKPVYMLGLTPDAEKHLNEKLPKSNSSHEICNSTIQSAKPRIIVEDINVSASCRTENTRESRQIQEAFNIVSEQLENNIITDLSMDLHGGEIVMVAGASGSGKSLLLNALAWHVSGKKKKWSLPREITCSSLINSQSSLKIATIQSAPKDKSPISLLMKLGKSMEESMRLLASAGLGEAQLFVRPSKTLSSGQHYRLSLALALAKNPDLLLIDEFCEPLDNYAAAAVCRRLRKEVKRRSIVAVVATINGDRILSELRPHRILRLLPNGQQKWENRNETHQKSYHSSQV